MSCDTDFKRKREDSDDEDGGEQFSEYGLSSPPQGEYQQTLSQAKKLIKNDGFGEYLAKYENNTANLMEKDKARGLVFLYGRGFFCGPNEERRKGCIETILKNPKAMVRLVRLLESDGADRDLTKSHAEFYVRHCTTLFRYFQQEGSFGFLPDDDENKGATYYFRIQKQGNCFIHAACVMMAYLFQHRGLGEGLPVDLSKFVRRVFTDDQLFKYIEADSGGSGATVLKTMLRSLFADKSTLTEYGYVAVRKAELDLKQNLKSYGPGLVSGFKCHKHFKNEEPHKNREKVGYIQFQGEYDSHGTFVELLPKSGRKSEDEKYKFSLHKRVGDYKNQQNTPQTLFPGRGTNKSLDAGSSVENESPAKEQTHAMVVIGGREVGGKRWLLLQNWWDAMQLVEVDVEYFVACNASLTFAQNTTEDFAVVSLEKFYTSYTPNSSLVADSNNLDKADYDRDDGCIVYQFPMDR